MERGPLALFGAIIALGLGPAMWLGAQFGASDVAPVRPPVIVVDQVPAPGGVGAGAEPEDDIATDVVKSNLEVDADAPRRPVESTMTARPAPTVDRPATPTATPPTTGPPPTAEPTPTTSAPVSTSPTEASAQPPAPAAPVLPLPEASVGVGVTLVSR